MGRIKIVWVIVLVFLPTLIVAATTHRYQLANGLQLFVRVDKRAPVVACEIWYKVGSSYEHNGITGISHVLEHMMFRGTKKFPAGEIEKIITANGGQFNAFTSQDYTGYYEFLDAAKLPLCFELESDRMRNLLLTQKDFAKEIQVVMEERRLRTDDNPQAVTAERFNAAAFIESPYHHPVIGWMKDLTHLTVEQVRQWYKTWYAPNNAVVVIVGDVKPQQVLQLAKRYFGSLKAEKLPRALMDGALRPLGKRSLTVALPAKQPWLMLGYNVPVLKEAQHSWQPYALAVLAAILAGGDSARLPKELVRDQQIALSVSADYSPFSRLKDLFTITAVPTTTTNITQLQTAIFAKIKQLQHQLVTPQELERVKAGVIAGRIYAKDSMLDQANEIGALEAVGLSWTLGRDFARHIAAITAQQVQAVAKEFLVPKRLTVAALQPLPWSAGTTLPAQQPSSALTGRIS